MNENQKDDNEGAIVHYTFNQLVIADIWLINQTGIQHIAGTQAIVCNDEAARICGTLSGR